jgi:hypothetical protein
VKRSARGPSFRSGLCPRACRRCRSRSTASLPGQACRLQRDERCTRASARPMKSLANRRNETRIQAAKPARSRGLRSGTERCAGALVRSREGAHGSRTLCHLSRGVEHVVILAEPEDRPRVTERSQQGEATGASETVSLRSPRGEDNAHGERRKSSKRVGRRETRDSSARASRRIGLEQHGRELVEAAVSTTHRGYSSQDGSIAEVGRTNRDRDLGNARETRGVSRVESAAPDTV